MTFKMLSERTNQVVVFESDGIRERGENEPLHFKEEEKQTECVFCGTKGFIVWTSNETMWEDHPNRCS